MEIGLKSLKFAQKNSKIKNFSQKPRINKKSLLIPSLKSKETTLANWKIPYRRQYCYGRTGWPHQWRLVAVVAASSIQITLRISYCGGGCELCSAVLIG